MLRTMDTIRLMLLLNYCSSTYWNSSLKASEESYMSGKCYFTRIVITECFGDVLMTQFSKLAIAIAGKKMKHWRQNLLIVLLELSNF